MTIPKRRHLLSVSVALKATIGSFNGDCSSCNHNTQKDCPNHGNTGLSLSGSISITRRVQQRLFAANAAGTEIYR
jgi:hypothetical protein